MTDAADFLPLGNPPSTSMRATSSRHDDQGPRQRARTDFQAITTLGVSGNASVVNVGGDHITNINDGLGADTFAILESIEMRLKVVHGALLDDKVDGWLTAPDVSQNLNAALRKRQAGTGAWFLDSPMFAEWKANPNRMLCIYGAPGCGKTVLCSSIIEAVKDWCATRPLAGWAYFFFDSRNANKGLVLYENFLRSILSQICSRCDGVPEAVEAMYRSHGKGRETPSVQALEETLRQVIGAFDDMYIVIDSLDECGDKIELLQWIQTVASWNSAKCHVVATTRPEPDITSRLELVRNIHTIYLQGSALDRDISNYLERRLSLITRWTAPIRLLITTTLLGGADGMFRWVAMHMDSLESCMNTREVKEKLKTLPKDLEDTYEQILTESPRQRELLHMLHWLAFSARELQVEEIAEVASVDFDAPDGPCYDPDLKYSSPSIALTVCSGLVTETDGIVKLAHFSVKEYLISHRIKTGMAAQFAMNARLSHSVIAQTCIAYLLLFNTPVSIQIPVEATGPFPLHLYAPEYTSSHLSLINTANYPTLQSLLLKLFAPAKRSDSALVHWDQMHQLDDDTPEMEVDVWLRKPADEVASPLYYASWLCLEGVVEQLLECGKNINLLGGRFGTALHAAAYGGSIKVVELLLERGADLNVQGGSYGTVLQAAARKCAFEMVKLLLECGANVNEQGGRFGTALQGAVSGGSIGVVELLLERGADPNIQGGWYGTALQAAAYQCSIKTVKLLLEHGADPNVQEGWHGTALQAAARQCAIEMVKLLLERGADPNIQGGEFGTALQAAEQRGSIETVKMLLEYDADPNIRGNFRCTALQMAAHNGFIEVVELLLERGANPNIQGGWYGTALQAAAQQCAFEMVKLLLRRGADPNIQGGLFGAALQVAASRGSIEVVKLLLERGADPDIQGGEHGTALQAAAHQGSIEAVKMLLQYGANPNIRGNFPCTALQIAARYGHDKIEELLLAHGATVEARDSSPRCESFSGST